MMSFWINIDSSITTLETQKLIRDETKILFNTHHNGRIRNSKIILNLKLDCFMLSTADNETTNETDNNALLD